MGGQEGKRRGPARGDRNAHRGLAHLMCGLVVALTVMVLAPGTSEAKKPALPASTLTETPAKQALLANLTVMAGKVWLIKSNDLQTIGDIGSYAWTGCGITTGSSLTSSTYPACQSGQVPIYTSHWTFQSDITSGALVSGDTVIDDAEEGWSITPKLEQHNLAYFDQLDAQLAAQNGITIIETPYGKTPSALVFLAKNAAKYAPIVDIQAQPFDRSPQTYVDLVDNTANAMRAINPDVVVLAGLATDASGVPTGLGQMESEYKGVKAYVDGFFLNATKWGRPRGKGCAPQGCPVTAAAFLNAIGATTSGGS